MTSPAPHQHDPGRGIRDARGHLIAALSYGGHAISSRIPSEETLANGDLFAAASDLLEAAKHAAMEWRLHGQLTDSCRKLEAAIAKATPRASTKGTDGQTS
jgi:hypothetical protein